MKRSLRDFLFTLFLAVVIFSVAAFFLLRSVEGLMGDLINKINHTDSVVTISETETADVFETQTAENAGTAEKPEDNIVTFCLVRLDPTKTKADAIFLAGVNATKREMVFTLVPTTTLDPDVNLSLGALYSSRGSKGIQNFLEEATGLRTDFYAELTSDGFSNMIDFFGGLSVNVPESFTYTDTARKISVTLEKGNQKLDGEQALAFLEYSGSGETAREDRQIAFARAFVAAFLRSTNVATAKNVYQNLSYHLKTDFTSNDFNNYADWIFAADRYATVSVRRIPGGTSGGGYSISASGSANVFDHFMK
ncbi:MAG: LCP family protein [Clostridia bacterium]|nr:LCP family protein [Clostridia bacterium]